MNFLQKILKQSFTQKSFIALSERVDYQGVSGISAIQTSIEVLHHFYTTDIVNDQHSMRSLSLAVEKATKMTKELQHIISALKLPQYAQYSPFFIKHNCQLIRNIA